MNKNTILEAVTEVKLGQMGLPIAVYRDTDKGMFATMDCTNGGISGKENCLLLIHPEGFIPLDINNIHLAVTVQQGQFGKSLVPVMRNPIHTNGQRKSIGPCFGGNFAYSCDSRFNKISQYPLPIHDRWDTQYDYDLLSQ